MARSSMRGRPAVCRRCRAKPTRRCRRGDDRRGREAYGVSLAECFHRTATYVVKILNCAKPGDLPVEFPTKLELLSAAPTRQCDSFLAQPVPGLFLFPEQIARNLFGTPVLLGALIWRPEEDFP
jgi:hypothetical protein